MKVTFDSNVWQIVVDPKGYTDDADITEFIKIREAILAGKVTPFLSETIFTLEGIRKKDRQEFLGQYKAKSSVTERPAGTALNLSFTLGPDRDAHPGNNVFLARYLKAAVAIGFQLIDTPRIGGIVNKEAEEHLIKLEGTALSEYLDRGFAAGERIEGLGSGMAPLMTILDKYSRPSGSIHRRIAAAPATEWKAISEAVAEWADADSIAAHIGIEGDYFCTRDEARGAGQSSILSAGNVAVLAREFDFKKVSPAELAALL